MNKKNAIRKKYFLNRSKNYFAVKKNFFLSIIKILRKYKKKKLGLYYPTSYELESCLFKILNFKEDEISSSRLDPIFNGVL